MNHTVKKIIAVSFIAATLSACGSETKMGSLTQTYNMTDAQGVHFGIVELDPINGGIVKDSQGRPFARVVPYQFSTASNQ